MQRGAQPKYSLFFDLLHVFIWLIISRPNLYDFYSAHLCVWGCLATSLSLYMYLSLYEYLYTYIRTGGRTHAVLFLPAVSPMLIISLWQKMTSGAGLTHHSLSLPKGGVAEC